jgi:hypothetical protein
MTTTTKKIIRKILPSFLYVLFQRLHLWISFLTDYFSFKKHNKISLRFPLLWENRCPCLFDKAGTISFDRHYIYHPAWAARILKKINPKIHYDISSTIAFSSVVSAFIPIKYYEYRPTELLLSNLSVESADLTNLPFKNNSIESISCMHTVEHVGLGRYGDQLDPNGDLKAIQQLKRVLASRGNLLFVVPIGKPKLMFNAHRIYSYEQIIDYFNGLKLVEFSLIPEKHGGIIYNATREQADNEKYGCGCFWFKK